MFYENYVRIRDERGMSDADVARASGVAPTTLSAWKTAYTPKLPKLKAIAHSLGVTLDQLITEEEGK